MDRRKARTRGALIRAAQSFIAQGASNVPILEITQAADVGLGSFYNHFESREQLFEAAVDNVLNRLGALLDDLTAALEDPADVFAQAFRLTGRLHRLDPELSKVLLNSGLALASSPRGLAPRARRDIDAAMRAGRFPAVRDLDLAMVIVGAPRSPSPTSSTTTPTATAPRPSTRSPKTCSARSGSLPPKPPTSATASCPPSSTPPRRPQSPGRTPSPSPMPWLPTPTGPRSTTTGDLDRRRRGNCGRQSPEGADLPR